MHSNTMEKYIDMSMNCVSIWKKSHPIAKNMNKMKCLHQLTPHELTM